MKKIVVFVAACFLFCGFLLTAQTASAFVSNSATSWEPNSNSVVVFSFVANWQNHSFLILDDGDDAAIDNSITLLNSTGPSDLLFSKDETTNVWSIKASDNLGNPLGTLELGATPNFDLCLYDGTNYHNSYSYDASFFSGYYEITYEKLGFSPTIFISGASPVPVPTSLLLLGSGLVGLFGLRRNQIMS